ncbi:MAG: DUF4846 domain-containing protein [Bacteroidota bacterium]
MLRLVAICLLFGTLYSCSYSEAGQEREDRLLIEPAAVQPESLLSSGNTYLFRENHEAQNALVNRIAAPETYQRVELEAKSFGEWLRFIPLKPGKPEVMLYNGQAKSYQGAHYAVIDIDAGTADLQQCADAVMRLRGEYLYSSGLHSQIHFNYTSGDEVSFAKWASGMRPVVTGNKVSWKKAAAADSSYPSFRKYMNNIFMYAGTLSLCKELKKAGSPSDIMPGDVFIVGGSPGHAVMVMDVAQNGKGEKVFLLAQSYMPAQDMHILVNPNNASLSPWYAVSEISEHLVTPEWTFGSKQLMRF